MTEHQERIAEIRERLAKATPGPWGAVLSDSNNDDETFNLAREVGVYYSGGDGIRYVLAAQEVSDEQQFTNVDLIANAPSDLAFLLAQLDAAQADTRRLDFLEAQTRNFKAPNLRVWNGDIAIEFYRNPFNPHAIGRDLREAIDLAVIDEESRAGVSPEATEGTDA